MFCSASCWWSMYNHIHLKCLPEHCVWWIPRFVLNQTYLFNILLYGQNFWWQLWAREKHCSRGKGLSMGGYHTGIYMDSNTNLEDPACMTSFAHQKNLCKWGWGGSEIRLAIINCKRRTDFAPTERPRCCGWIFSNYFFGTFRRPNCMARVTQNLKADPSCHNTNVFQIGTRVNVSSTRVIAFFKVKPSRGSNNSSLL